VKVGRSHRQAGQVAVLALLLSTGCTLSRSVRQEVLPLETQAGTFRLEYPRMDEAEVAMIRSAIERAGPQLSRWGTLQKPVTVRVHEEHTGLEKAAKHSNYPWLRAWARYDVVDVQAPQTWHPLRATQRDLDELLLHELTHSLMYQVAADPGGWRHKKIPAWFREGMASFTAEQSYRWPTLEQLTRTLEQNPTWEPLLRPEPLQRDHMPVVYGAAHHAFTFLVHRYGEDTIRALLREMNRGPDFPAAFTATVGLPPEIFLRDFTRYLRLRGFTGARKLRPEEPPVPR
jgi:hypothetical protein